MIRSIYSQQNLEVNLSEEVMLLANNITCRTSLGKRYYSGEGATRILKETQALFMGFFFADYVPTLGWLDKFTGMRERLEENFRELDGFFQRVIDEHLDPLRKGDTRDEDVVEALLDLRRWGRDVSDEHIKGVLMNIFVAGSDTSSATLDWTMAELMRNPEVMRKAQNEVRRIIRNKEKVVESDLDQLHYMKSIVKESLRLHSPVPLLVQRETIQHFKINGYDIPAKTRLLINMWTIGKDGDVWENPEEFYPERFIDSSVDFRGQHFELIPFGAGRRICPGLNSGMLVVELALANLLYLFDWEMPNGMTKNEINMSESPGVTVHRRFPLRLQAKRFSGLQK
ncbi:uncharacterized protein A4U43_C05F22780 [Asparagus officinalis]|uniref:Cytochrome P450 n=2 Tax=Asparagus officinalis TaxID=4686 RepID=A0A5P1EW83_ASPOF|nr:uncharacterized protein A4U43_C05F22780 [Asparagus officinalis]